MLIRTMLALQVFKQLLIRNFYLILGTLVGIYLSYYVDVYELQQIQTNYVEVQPQNSISNVVGSKIETETKRLMVTSKKPVVTKKDSEKIVRPRYYSTELGIRQKLFVGVLTSEDKVSQAGYINKTITHVADKVKFFMTVRNKMKSTFNLSGIVGFTDTRHKYRPFQILKYIADTFMHDYDFYFLMNDYNFVNIRKLRDIVGKISVSKDVYLGVTGKDSSFCNLDAGIILSNSVVQAMKNNLDWCIANAISDDHSENLGRCVYHSINLECSNEIQGQHLSTFKIKHFKLEKYLEKVAQQNNFNQALTIYPILEAQDFYLLNAYFSRLRLELLQHEIHKLSINLNDTWPPGQRTGAKPATRFDLPPQLYFNMTHMYYADDFTNIRKHTTADYVDIQNIIEAVKAKVLLENPDMLQYRRLVNGYRTFDLSRGMDYTIDLGFRDLNTGKEVLKRYEVCKPLGKVEFVPVPYVTEIVRVTILLPIQEDDNDLAIKFINDYSKSIMEHKTKALLMLVLFYQYSTENKGTTDVFRNVKQLALKLSSAYKNEEMKIVWVSIRLPKAVVPLTLENNKVLDFAMIDLALKKIGLETLVLVANVYATFTMEFLNRVRMNTIIDFQVFSPIPFRQYDPQITKIPTLDVNKNTGHFDKDDFKYISFYGKDYVHARKKAQHEVPIIRTDADIGLVINSSIKGNVFELFVKYSDNLHCMRATEMDLKVRYHEVKNADNSKNLFFGNKLQLAKLILTYQDKLGTVF